MSVPDPASESAEKTPSPARDAWARRADRAWDLVRRVHLGTRQPGNWVQLFKFGAVGGSGYAINLVVYTLLIHGFGTGFYFAAAVGAFLVAVTSNFIWNRVWTFKADKYGIAAPHQGARFFAVSLGGLVVNLAVLEALVSGVGLSELPSQAIAVAVAMPANFIGNKLWTFSR